MSERPGTTVAGFEIVTVDEQLGPEGLASLEPLAREIFGDQRRAPGWFVRKLRREAVDPALSSIAVDARLGRADGYFLVGQAPAHAPTTCFTAGLGVVQRSRGLGLGRALVHVATERAAARGVEAFSLLSAPDKRGFYRRLGFRERAAFAVWQQRGRAEPSRLTGAPQAWTPAGAEQHEVVGQWRAETWMRTPPPRWTLVLAGSLAHVSREGEALLVHRLLVPPPAQRTAAAAIAKLLDVIPLGTPVLLYGCPMVSFFTQHLSSTGWSIVQRSHVMIGAVGDLRE